LPPIPFDLAARTGLFALTGRRLKREANDEFAALVGAGAMGLDRATVQLDQPLGEVEPDAQPAAVASHPAIALHEQIENMRQRRRFDSGAVVAHPNDSNVPFQRESKRYRDPPGRAIGSV